jgi:hypothetical protein
MLHPPWSVTHPLAELAHGAGHSQNEEPDYWPEVEETEQGMKIKYPTKSHMKTRQEMGYTDGLSIEEAIIKFREPGSRW